MSKARRYITAGGTLACALGIGYFMQAGAQSPAQNATAIPGPALEAPVEITQIELTSAGAVPPMAAPEPVALPATPVTLAVAEDVPLTDTLPEEEIAPSFACDYIMEARAQAAAMVEVTLSAPCQPNTNFTLHHNGMMFTAVTDDQGESTLTIPALAEAAVFIAAFEDGEGAISTATMDTLALYDRFVVQWRGGEVLHLHAFEYGAEFGGSGHVWANASEDMTRALKGEGGFLTSLGEPNLDQGLRAEVYTFPTGAMLQDGVVHFQVEAEVTDANCSRDFEAQSIATGAEGLVVQDIVLAMPDCEGIGDFLVLKNLFNDLKIASN
ncbi:hypothetical protein KZZ08_04700 [Roseovarius mucosus]|uniref:hypothetical protein n=1 Tax=Roseovarius mucosus TaxID=215743 RepID=UPI001C600BFB|nr:hypothetical protein [Roseovarius mucosus]MBW4972902.1 hypothetical protein [Roseovarius mucosus]